MTDESDHDTRRKPIEIVRQSQAYLINVLNWRNIGYVIVGFVGLSLLFMIAYAIAPSSTPPSTPSAPGSGSTSVGPVLGTVLVLLAIAALVVLIAQWRPAVFASGSRPSMPKGLVWVIIAVLVVLAWVNQDYWMGSLPLETQVNVLVAQKRITDNLFLVLVAFAIAFLFVNKKAAAVLGALAALVFFLSTDNLGLTRAEKVHAWWNTPSAPRQYAEPRKEWGLAVAPTSPCKSREVPYLYEERKPARPFNKAGQCGPVLWHKGYCVWALGYKSSTPVRLCDKPGMPRGEVPLSMEYVWSAEGHSFQDKYRLDPPRYTTLLNIAQ